ncbi:jg17581 [Pararge aegeria aegeria]|uniref:Phospholipid scramblase n=1 Tax=Pararge aegeria aegeria TaxID=348720 RepID=A0A8S4RQB3_9NEOP|nr:jg17581 [Pararge aegeria aegeria]
MMMQAAPIPPALSEPYEAFVKEPVQQPPEVKPADEDTQPQVEPENVLHDLTSVGRLCITKRLQVKSVLFLRGKKNRFLVRTQENNLIYKIQEQNSWWVGYFCYGLRPLQLHVRDGTGAEVMRIYRPYACTSRIFPCQLQRIQLYVTGPRVTISFFRDIQFHIYRTDGTAVGSTCKRWQGILHAMFFAPVSDKFGIAFERDLSVEEKALLLAATLLLDYMYYDV